MKKLDYELFDQVLEQATVNPRRRMHYDLRTQAAEPKAADGSASWHDTSMKMLNVLMHDTVIPVHRHANTNEVVVVMRGSGVEVEYDVNDGTLIEIQRVHLSSGSQCSGVVVGRGVWHTFIPNEDGTVIFEAKDGAYDPNTTEELFVVPR